MGCGEKEKGLLAGLSRGWRKKKELICAGAGICADRKSLLAAEVTRGLERMRASTANLCFLVRNGAAFLRRNIPDLQRIQESFARCNIVAVENDSKDDTVQVLQAWQKARAGVQVLSEATDARDNFSGATPGVHPGFSFYRIRRMASFRNKYMEYLESSLPEADYLLVIDIDTYGFPLESVATAFGQEIEWDVMTGNYLWYQDLAHGYLYYDGFALHPWQDKGPLTHARILENIARFSGLRPGMLLIRVDSAFNGLAVYRAQAVRGCRYESLANGDPQVESLCCHTGLHRQMAAKGFDRVYLNPAQLLYARRFREWLKKLV